MLRLTLDSFRSGGAILCFHGVTGSGRPAKGSAHVPIEAFTSFVHLARRLGTLVPLSELVQRHAAGRDGRPGGDHVRRCVPGAGVGPCSRLHLAPRRPVTVFVVTSAAETGAAYWWIASRICSRRSTPIDGGCSRTNAACRTSTATDNPPATGRCARCGSGCSRAHGGRWPRHLEPALFALECEAGRSTSHRSMT